MREEDLVEIIIQTKEWYNGKVSQIEQIVSSIGEAEIKFQGDDGNQSELPEEHEKGFKLGLMIALEILGKYPVSINDKEEEEE